MEHFIICTSVTGGVMSFFQNDDEILFTVSELDGPPGQGYGVWKADGLEELTDQAMEPLVKVTTEEYSSDANAQRVAVQLAYQMTLRHLGIIF